MNPLSTVPHTVRWSAGRAMAGDDGSSSVVIFGVRVSNLTRQEAGALFAGWAAAPDRSARRVFIVNAHTLTLAYEDAAYREVLNGAVAVFGDGTGVRWAARLRGVRMKDNLVGTDLFPYLFASPEGEGLRYYFLGGAAGVAARATARLHSLFPRLDVVGYRDGYFPAADTEDVIRSINDAAPDVLLVAMGNPRQEAWIHQHSAALRVPVAIGVGGLFDHWAGRLRRAPAWVRELGIEWMQILMQQPHKWRRYVLGNPKFLARAASSATRERGAR